MKAVIDIGTNSVRLLVAKRQGGRVEPLLREAKVTRIGQGVDSSLRLPVDGMERTLQALQEYKTKIPSTVEVQVIATSAVRDATNREDFRRLVREKTGWELQILSGEEEAELSFQGALLDLPPSLIKEPLSVVDIGGGSTEIYTGDATGKLLGGGSAQVGAVRMLERFITAHPVLDEEQAAMEGEVRRILAPLAELNLGYQPKGLVAVGGTATSLAAILQNLDQFDHEQVTGSTISYLDLVDLAKKLGKLSLEERSLLPTLQKGREDVIVCGACILIQTMELLGFQELVVSCGDLLYSSL